LPSPSQVGDLKGRRVRRETRIELPCVREALDHVAGDDEATIGLDGLRFRRLVAEVGVFDREVSHGSASAEGRVERPVFVEAARQHFEIALAIAGDAGEIELPAGSGSDRSQPREGGVVTEPEFVFDDPTAPEARVGAPSAGQRRRWHHRRDDQHSHDPQPARSSPPSSPFRSSHRSSHFNLSRLDVLK
jgi:hypothetical protein